MTKALRDTALVTLLTDKESAVTAKDQQTGAIGIVRHSQGPEDLLFLDSVFKDKLVNTGDVVVTAGKQSGKKLSSFYPRGIPIGQVTKVGQTDVDPFQDVQLMPFVDFTSLDFVLVLASESPDPQCPDGRSRSRRPLRFFFVVAILQVTIVSSIGILGGSPDLVLVTLVAVALTQGSIFGAVTGFWAGLLIDVARLGTLGFTSLLLTLAGFWIGRYGETTGRDRAHAPLLSVGVVTVLYAIGSLVMHFLLREPASAKVALVDELPATIALNLLITFPVFALVKWMFKPAQRAPEVEFVG